MAADGPLELVMFAGIVLAIIEWVSSLLMLPWTFKMGVPIARRIASAPARSTSLRAGTHGDVVLQSSGEDRWIFRHVWRLSEWSTPFPVRGVATMAGQKLEIVGRVPIGSLIFVAALAAQIGHWSGWLGTGVLCTVAWLMEEPRFDRDAEAVRRVLAVSA